MHGKYIVLSSHACYCHATGLTTAQLCACPRPGHACLIITICKFQIYSQSLVGPRLKELLPFLTWNIYQNVYIVPLTFFF